MKMIWIEIDGRVEKLLLVNPTFFPYLMKTAEFFTP